MEVKERRNYLERVRLDIDKYGIEYIMKIISDEHLKRHYICRDWKENPNFSRDYVARIHQYHKTTNFCRICGPKNSVKK